MAVRRKPGWRLSREPSEAAPGGPVDPPPFSRRDHQLATIEARAPALDGLLEEPFCGLGFPDRGIQFRDLRRGKALPALTGRTLVRQKGPDLVERKADVLQQGNQAQLVDCVRFVPPPAAHPRDWLEKPNLLVIPQG
jgi:hypothetical protein